jgi:hypothetical protein
LPTRMVPHVKGTGMSIIWSLHLPYVCAMPPIKSVEASDQNTNKHKAGQRSNIHRKGMSHRWLRL